MAAGNPLVPDGSQTAGSGGAGALVPDGSQTAGSGGAGALVPDGSQTAGSSSAEALIPDGSSTAGEESPDDAPAETPGNAAEPAGSAGGIVIYNTDEYQSQPQDPDQSREAELSQPSDSFQEEPYQTPDQLQGLRQESLQDEIVIFE